MGCALHRQPKAIKMQMIENDRIRKSWNYMYNNNGKEVKKLMEKAYIYSEQAEGSNQTISK